MKIVASWRQMSIVPRPSDKRQATDDWCGVSGIPDSIQGLPYMKTKEKKREEKGGQEPRPLSGIYL